MMGKYSPLEIETEDTAEILMECERAPLVEVHLDYVQRVPSRTCQIIGSEGTIRWDYYSNQVSVLCANPDATETYSHKGFERNEMYLAEMGHFLKCLDNHETPVVTFKDGRMALEIAMAARLSSKTGQTYRLASPLGELK